MDTDHSRFMPGESPRTASPEKPSTLGNKISPESPREPQKEPAQPKKFNKNIVFGAVGLVLLCMIAALVLFIIHQKKQVEEERLGREAAELTLQQDLANSEFENLEQEFAGLENPTSMIATDSVKVRLTEKYESARLEVERLQKELKEAKNRSAKEIADLRAQIATLRALLKHYIEEIDRLNKENEALRTENTEIKEKNQRLTSQVEETTRENKNLSERMTLAEKLNVTGVSLSALNAKGKVEKKIKKAKQLMVTFTIPQNNSTPAGEKTFWVRITSPEGQLMEGGGTFKFEGQSVAASARKTVDYGGEEIAGIHIYYDVRTALSAGTYTVELFTDNYRVASRQFTLN